MDTMEVKQGLGSITRTHEPITLFHVVVNGHTIATHTSRTDAYAYAFEYMARGDRTKTYTCSIK